MRRVVQRCLGPACLIAWAVAAGCAVEHEKDPGAYRAVLGRSEQAPPERIDHLTLRQAINLANEHNQELGIEGERFVQALIDKHRAAAEFLPTISLSPSYTRSDVLTSDQAGGTGGGNLFNAPVDLQYTLFRGYRNVADLERAKSIIAQRRGLLLDLQGTVLLDVAQAFYQVLASERTGDVLRNTLTLREERLRDVRARQVAGVARPLDVSQTEAQAAGTRVALVTAQRDVKNGREALTLLIGVAVQEAALEDDLALPDAASSVREWQELSLQRRQAIVAAMAGVRAAKHQVQSAMGEYYPTVTLNLEWALSIDAVATETAWRGVVSANVPIFSAGRIEANVRTAWSELRQATLEELLARRETFRDVAVAYGNLLAAADAIRELQVQLTAAREALRQAERSYDVGLATNLERLTAQDQMLATELDLLQAEFDRRVAYLALQRAAGVLAPDSRTPRSQPATKP